MQNRARNIRLTGVCIGASVAAILSLGIAGVNGRVAAPVYEVYAVRYGTTFDATANLAAQDRMRRLVAAKRYIIPGHDSAIVSRFPAVQKDVVRID